jgi:allophanate hydrolase subunit 1
MTNAELSKALSTIRHSLQSAEQHGIREACRNYANLLIEARPGRFVRREAMELLRRCEKEAAK